jgi:hypothetical protein
VKLFKKLIVFGETYHTLVETKPKCVVSWMIQANHGKCLITLTNWSGSGMTVNGCCHHLHNCHHHCPCPCHHWSHCFTAVIIVMVAVIGGIVVISVIQAWTQSQRAKRTLVETKQNVLLVKCYSKTWQSHSLTGRVIWYNCVNDCCHCHCCCHCPWHHCPLSLLFLQREMRTSLCGGLCGWFFYQVGVLCRMSTDRHILHLWFKLLY